MIYSVYKPPKIDGISPRQDSETVQGLVTSLSAILNGYDDNNMSERKMSYSGDEVVDLYPEAFGRPTKYELEYLKVEYPDEPGGPSDIIPPAESSPAPAPSETDTTPSAAE